MFSFSWNEFRWTRISHMPVCLNVLAKLAAEKLAMAQESRQRGIEMVIWGRQNHFA